MKRFSTMRVAAMVAVCGALGLAGCGGGGSQSMMPIAAQAGSGTQSKVGNATATLSIVGLAPTTSAQNSTRTSAIPASTRRSTAGSRAPQYLDQTTPNSAIVITVQPQDPAEAGQYGNLNVCYNLYTNGTLNAAIAAGSPPVVTVAFPAPPGTDGFQVSQYAGQCSSAYTVPTPPAGSLNGGLLSQTPLVYANITAGASATTNNINTLVGACTQPTTPPAVGSGFLCVGPGSGVTTITSTISIAKVQFDATVPITNPVREQGGFLSVPGVGVNKIGIPIPLEGINAAGTVVPGLPPGGGSGPFPTGVTVTLAENLGGTTGNAAHAKLYLMDAKTGVIAQNGSGLNQSISITEFNALDAADNVTGAGGIGDQWALILTYDGTGYLNGAGVISETVTATATAANAALPAPISLTISPQSAVYSAGGTGYTDAAGPFTAPVGLLQPTAGGSIYVTDGGSLKIDGSNTVSAPATGTSLTGLASATWPNTTSFIYAVDNGQAGGATSTESASGLYAFNTTSLAATPVSAAAGANNYVQFPNPVAVVQAQGPSGAGHPYLYVISGGGGIYKVDISGASEVAPIGGFQEATNVLPIITTTGTLNPNGAKYLGTATLASGVFLVADPGNNRIAQVDATQTPAVITAWATGQPFVGFTLPNYPTSAAMYATTTSGQIYYISGSGATPVSLGFSASATSTDGPIGQVTSLTTTNTLTPINYPLQGQAASFFATTATPTTTGYGTPYTIAPFAAAGPVFSAAATGIGLANDTSFAKATGKGTVYATGGILIPAVTTPTATLTPGSILFTDTTNKQLRTIVQ